MSGATVERDGDDFRFHLDVLRAACSKCNEENLLPVQKVCLGFRFSCQRCGQVHSIVDHHWEFQPVGDPPTDDPTE